MWMIRLWFKWIAPKNEWCAKKFVFLYVFDSFPPFYAQKWIPPVALCSFALFLKATVSNLIRSLMTKEWREGSALFHEHIALSLTKNEQIAQKTHERIPNPKNQHFKSENIKRDCINFNVSTSNIFFLNDLSTTL